MSSAVSSTWPTVIAWVAAASAYREINRPWPTLAAACCVAPLCDHVDLDGNLLLREDPCPGVELVDGVQVPSTAPGLGVAPGA